MKVILILKQMQRWIFFAMMHQIGIDMTKSTIWCEDGNVMPSSDLFEPKTKYVVGWCRYFDQFPAPKGLKMKYFYIEQIGRGGDLRENNISNAQDAFLRSETFNQIYQNVLQSTQVHLAIASELDETLLDDA